MHAPLTELTADIANDDVTIRGTDWGDFHVAFETYHTAFDMTPLLVGLPDDQCQSPHWGIVLKGEMQVRYADHTETVNAGEVYYLAPGHIVATAPGTELVEFSPKEPYAQTMEVAGANYMKMIGAA